MNFVGAVSPRWFYDYCFTRMITDLISLLFLDLFVTALTWKFAENDTRITFKQLIDEFYKADSEQAALAKEAGFGKEDVSVCVHIC